MSPVDCPFEDIQTLYAHSKHCQKCAARQSDVLSLAIQIVLAETTGSVVYEKGVPRLLIINPNNDSPSETRPEFLFRDFVRLRYIPGPVAFLRPGARKIYEFVLRRYVLPEIGSLRLSEITFEIVQGLVANLLKAGYSVQTAKHAKMVTHRVFVHAERVGAFRGRFPTTGIRFPTLIRRERHALTIEQARLVLQHLRSPNREIALVSMTTSMNVAEMFGLRWKRVNLDSEPALCGNELIPAESLIVRETHYEGAFGPPKTVNRKRTIPLAKAVVSALRELKAASRFSGPDDIVFASRNGTPKLSSNVRHHVIKPLGEKLGLPWLTLHTFRYTYATIGEQLGISLSDRQAQMGHGSIWMTQEYTVSNMGNRRAGTELIAETIA